MAEQGSHSLRVGIVMVLGIAILAVAIFSIGGGLRWLGGTEELTARFQRVNGLQVGAPVHLSGVNIGSVASIQFPSDRRANYVVVRLSIEANAVERVRTDSVAKIESLGLLGDKFLLLTAGSPDAPSVEAEALLKSQDPVNYQSLLQARGTGDLVANIIAISSSMRQLLDTVNEGNGILAELIKGPSNPKEKTLTLASMRETLDNLQKLTAKLELAVDRVDRGQGVIGAMLSPREQRQASGGEYHQRGGLDAHGLGTPRSDFASASRPGGADGHRQWPAAAIDGRPEVRRPGDEQSAPFLGRHARGARQDQRPARHARPVDQRSVALRQDHQPGEREWMGLLAVQGRLQRDASVRHHGLAELCAAAGRTDELQPGSQ